MDSFSNDSFINLTDHKRKELLILLKKWFDESKRELPWRKEKNPYKVLVSEMMLQQTRAQTVIPFFTKWIKQFPDFFSLASADEAEVMKAWEGLGYYSRARNLHKMAKMIVKEYGGRLPEEEEILKNLKGIGPYMLGAIQSFGFGKKKAAVDGNVTRVISRLFSMTEPIHKASSKKTVQQLATLLVEKSPDESISESLIELGALVCQKRPKCEICPLSSICMAKKKGLEEKLPINEKKERTVKLLRTVFVLEWNGHWLIREESSSLMKGLYHFFYQEALEFALLHKKREELLEKWETKIEKIQELSHLSQFFTKYACTLFPFHIVLKKKIELSDYIWVPKKNIPRYPFSSGPRKIIRFLL